jgi:hypothetical protein
VKAHQAEDTIAVKPVMGVFVGVVVVIFLSAIWVSASMSDQIAGIRPEGFTERTLPPPHQVNAMEMYLFAFSSDALLQRSAKEDVLGGYGWVDRKSGVVRIPVDRAMDLYLDRNKEGR